MRAPQKKIAVILAGCGVFDGSEIYETVLTLLYIRQGGSQYQCFAPNKPMMHVIDHQSQNEMPEMRNVLCEAARLARGEIEDLSTLNVDDFDAVIVPGGFGAAKNLSNFAQAGSLCEIDTDFACSMASFYQQKKPIGLMCIAPALAPKLISPGVKCTIGEDKDTAAVIEQMGGTHVNCQVDQIVEDIAHKLYTTPAFMLANHLEEAAPGIEKLVKAVIKAS